MQEDKYAVFNVTETVKDFLPVFCGMLESIKIDTGTMRRSAPGAYTNAADAAEWFVKKGAAS